MHSWWEGKAMHLERPDKEGVSLQIAGASAEIIVPLDSGCSVEVAIGMIMEIVPLHLVTEVIVPIDGGALSHEDMNRLVAKLSEAGLNVALTLQGSRTTWHIDGRHMTVNMP